MDTDQTTLSEEPFLKDRELPIRKLEAKLKELQIESYDIEKLKRNYLRQHVIKQFLISFLIDYWLEHPDFTIKISSEEIQKTSSGIFVSFPFSFLSIVQNKSLNFFQRAQSCIESGEENPSNLQFSLMLWSALTSLVGMVPFVQGDLSVVPQDTDASEVEEVFELEAIKPADQPSIEVKPVDLPNNEYGLSNDIYIDTAILIGKILTTNYELTDDRRGLKLKEDSKVRDTKGINKYNVGLIWSGVWIPEAFFGGHNFKFTDKRTTLSTRVNNGYVKLEIEKAGKLIIEILLKSFDGLNLEVPEQ
ncbi:MAG: hypothetical protein ACMG57_04455 [Candidatus Dojkabacteria bacterium]